MNACAAAAGATSSSWSRASSTSTSSSAPTIALLLDAETFVRIAPQTRRRLRSGPEGARLLLIGGTPGRAYAPTANTELGGPEVLDSPTASSAMLPGGPPPMLST